MLPKLNSAHGSETRNIINRAIDVLNQQGKMIQYLVADGQLTEEQYAELLTIINGLVRRGQVGLNDVTPELISAIEGGEGTSFNLESIPRDFSVGIQKLDDDLRELLDLTTNNLFRGNAFYGTVHRDTGELDYVGDEGRLVTDFIPIEPGKKIKNNLLDITTSTTGNNIFIFYDKNKEFVSSSTVQTDEIIAPNNAHFVRQNLKSASFFVDPDYYWITNEDRLYTSTIDDNRRDIDNLKDKIESIGTKTGLNLQNACVLSVSDFDNVQKTDSEIISDCLSFAEDFDDPVIVFDGRDWYIDEAILLPSNTTVIVDGCMIKQNDEVFDNIFRGDNLEIDPENPYGYPLSIEEITNIKIIGINGATLEGPDVNIKMVHHVQGLQTAVGDFWGWRTFHICLSKASHFEISGFKMRKTRCWGVSFDRCHDYKVHDLDYNSNVKNGDGVNNRVGCYNFEIYNITGSTSDDTVAMTALGHVEQDSTYPRENYVYPLEPTRSENLNLPKEDLAIKNGKVYNITTTGDHHGVICLSATGLKVHDISINNIKEPSPSTRESVVKIYTGYGSGYTGDDINNIRVNNILSKGAIHGVQITPKVGNVWVNKVVQENTGGNVVRVTNTNGVTITNS